MIEWIFWGVFWVLALGAIALALYPLRRSKGLLCAVLPVMIAGVMLAYGYWGHFSAWQKHEQRLAKQREVQGILTSVGGTDALIAEIKTRLDQTPASAHGWYLIGKLYVTQHDSLHAKEAFALAHELTPDDEQITLHYAQSIWDFNQQAFNQSARALLHAVLSKNPKQPDALAMLAMDAFTRHHYKTAIRYWEQLLSLLPPQSEEAGSIRQAIVKARAS